MSATPDFQLRILLVVDDADVRETLGESLRGQGHAVVLAESGHAALERLTESPIDIAITDIRMPGMDGFALLGEIRERLPSVEVIVVTAHGDVDSAVRALRDGAFDYFTKPSNVEDIAAALRRTARFAALRRENERHRERWERQQGEQRHLYGKAAILGESDAIRQVREQIAQVSETDTTTVLIRGETGTGKELVARAVHYESARAEGPLVTVDCTSLPETLVESELFGHVRGAFTDARDPRQGRFEQAHGGTLFLDEIGDMPANVQMRLLRVLEERNVRPLGGSTDIPVNVRVISATNRDLPQGVEAGDFRRDLYYRLNTFAISLPPLRERPEDIRPTALHFLTRFAGEQRKAIAGLSSEAWSALESYSFPGNVRELRNLVERAVLVCRGEQIGIHELHFDGKPPSIASDAPDLNLPAAERSLILAALERADGSKAEAARLLGISRDSLRRRLERQGIT